MADSFTSSGLTLSTISELVTQLENDFKAIYGNDINIEQNSPDGQMINIFAQGGSDVRELISQLYTSFDPDGASGRTLDARCAINNVYRKGGTFTEVNITIVTDRAVDLQGVDENYNDPSATGYTIQDDAGNQFVLKSSQSLVSGTNTNIVFRAKDIGAVETIANTITTPVTVVLGVLSVNNPAKGVTGVNEETDAQLKVRRRQSLSIGASGYLNGLQASLSQLDGVTNVKVYENPTGSTDSDGIPAGSTDSDGIPAHSIWVVISGGANSDIADTIYKKRSAGCNMYGSQSYTIITPSGQSFVAKWSAPTSGNLYIKFNIQKILSSATFDTTKIANYISSNLSFDIGDGANTSDITAIAQEAIDANGGNGAAVGVLISTDNTNWVEYVAPQTAVKLSVTSVVPTVL